MAQVGCDVWSELLAQVCDQLRTRVRAQIGHQLKAQLRDQVWQQVRAQIEAQVGDELRARLQAQVVAQLWRACSGPYDATRLSQHDFLARLGGAAEHSAAFLGVARSAGWWWAFRDVAVLTERPVALHRDERGRLHRAEGMALEYPDGWGIYAWHGVRVPAQVILAPRSLTVEQIRDERNAEVRRVMLERFGQARYLRESGARLVHQDDWGELYRAEFAGDEDLVMVKVVNATPELMGERAVYWLRVPPQMQTARQAVAWTFDKSPEDYQPAVET